MIELDDLELEFVAGGATPEEFYEICQNDPLTFCGIDETVFPRDFPNPPPDNF